jgi:anti-sigma-K factor RskA
VVSLTRRRMNDSSPHELAAAYALDALDGDDLRGYEVHLAGCERCRDDVAGFRETAAALAYDVEPLQPPETLERRILSAARAERPNVVPLRRRWAVPAVALGAIAAAAAIVVGIWAVHLSNSLDHERSARKSQKGVLDVLSDCSKIPMGGSASLCVAPTRRAVLIADSLASASPDRTYEAWVVSGKRPEPAGLFRGGAGRRYVPLTKPVPAGATVGVTLERAGGSASPTGAMLLKAEVKRS